MQSDPFAALRKRDTGISRSYFDHMEHQEHVCSAGVFPENPQKSAVAHREHPEHLKLVVTEDQAARATAPPVNFYRVPEAWRPGLQRLNVMPRPDWVEAGRWRQIVTDAFNLAGQWYDDGPAIARWSCGSVFGFDPARPTLHSLVLDIRGGAVVDLYNDGCGHEVATLAPSLANRRSGLRYHHQQMPDDASPIWLLGQAGDDR
ncbi:hypothetical protein [Sphingomonas sp. PB4P5]|uniref:hypothetical protein n=1 Tax=Parasphingomonas puruogangriensis TaxID=3096155 RepID=UPI002FCCAA1E